MIVFEIPYPKTSAGKAAWNRRYGLNAYYAGKHWSQRKKDVEELHALCLLGMKKAGIRRELVKYPVEVRFYWDDNLDIDNHAALGKAFVDAMKGYILPDDNRKWFRRVVHDFWSGGDSIRVEVKEYPPVLIQYPMGVYTFPIACYHCKHRGEDRCSRCKAEIESGFEIKGSIELGRKWIPVTERLPEKWRDEKRMIDYLIFMPDFGVNVGNYGALVKQWLYMGIPVKVTHWAPLPEPPEVDG